MILSIPIVYFVFFLQWYELKTLDLNKTGLLGDSFGIITCIFSCLAFWCMGVSLYIQQNQFKKHSELEREQSIEDNVFKLLARITNAVEHISGTFPVENISEQYRASAHDNYLTVAKRNYFAMVCDELMHESINKQNHGRYVIQYYEAANKKRWNTQLSNYFRLIYRTIHYIDEAEVCNDERKFLARLVRTSFSDQELGVLFVNCISKYGSKFKRYVEKYEFFDNLPPSMIPAKELILEYDRKAYGDNQDLLYLYDCIKKGVKVDGIS